MSDTGTDTTTADLLAVMLAALVERGDVGPRDVDSNPVRGRAWFWTTDGARYRVTLDEMPWGRDEDLSRGPGPR